MRDDEGKRNVNQDERKNEYRKEQQKDLNVNENRRERGELKLGTYRQ